MVRRLTAGAGIVFVCSFLGACREKPSVLQGAPAGAPTVLASDNYQANVGGAAQRHQLALLRRAVTRLRDATTSGWQARQDDETGLAGELSGGTWRAPARTAALDAVRTFLDRYGDAFGLTAPAEQLASPADLPADDDGSAIFRATQVHKGLPVDGGYLLVALDDVPTRPAISLARGRIYQGLDEAPTSPQIPAAQAAAEAARATGGTASGEPQLVVYPKADSPVLAWVVGVNPAPQPAPGSAAIERPSLALVDATTAALIEVRAGAEEFTGWSRLGRLLARAEPARWGNDKVKLPPPGKQITVKGKVTGGVEVEVPAEQLPDGSIVFIDASQPGADRASGRGVISVHDGSKLQGFENLPGPLLRLPAGAKDSDALTAAWSAKQVLDYFRTVHGLNSYDGHGSPLATTVHFKAVECNAFFMVRPPEDQQMVAAEPCESGGQQITTSMVDLAITAHEVGHGVAHAGLATESGVFGDRIQETAVSEGIADYFGVVVQNLGLGKNYSTVGVLACKGVKANAQLCTRQRDGQKGVRNVDTGATMEDYEANIIEPLGLASVLGDDGHANSMVLTNALWKIRRSFAALDGGKMLTSEKAKLFDRVVLRAVLRYFTSDTDFLATAEAITRAAGEVKGVGARERALIRRQFRQSKICRGCIQRGPRGLPVRVSPLDKSRPHITDAGVVFTEWAAQKGLPVSRGILGVTGQPTPKSLTPSGKLITRVVGAGEFAAEVAVSATNLTVGELTLRNLKTGKSESLSRSAAGLVPPGISRGGVAWLDLGGDKAVMRFRPLAGGAGAQLPVATFPIHVATEGTRVAFEDEEGTLFVWDTGGSTAREIGTTKVLRDNVVEELREENVFLPPGGLALSGNRLAVLTLSGSRLLPWAVLVIDLRSGKPRRLSTRAAPFGIAMDGDTVIWSELVGKVRTKISIASGSDGLETDIKIYSFKAKKYFRVLRSRGQQGFPTIDGRRVAWQDSSLGGNDIFYGELPAGF